MPAQPFAIDHFQDVRFELDSFDQLFEAVEMIDRRRVDSGQVRSTSVQGSVHHTELEERAMRVMVIVKANKESEAGRLPDQKELTEMGEFNEELVKAGVMLAGEGLRASSKGARVKFDHGKKTVIDGPFAETKELIAGFWLWQVKSMAEAIEWLKRAPFREGEVEIRQVFEASDFGDSFSPELREQEERLRAAGGYAERK